MDTPNKYCLVGAGGIGCFIMPMLCHDADLLICDGDNYEPKNHDRQFPSLTSTDNKALVLSRLAQERTFKTVSFIPAYVKDLRIKNWPEFAGVDCLVGAVDNNASRRALIDIGMALSIPVVLAGNSHNHGEAHMMIPDVYNPLEHFPFADTEPAPWACNASKTLEEHPQTALANLMAASAAMHILLSWRESLKPENCIVYSRLDPHSSNCRRAKNILADVAHQA